MQNLVVVSHNVCAHVGPNIFGDPEDPPPRWDGGVADTIAFCCPTCYRTCYHFVAIGQTVWSYGNPPENFDPCFPSRKVT